MTWLKLSGPALAALTASACSARDRASPFSALSDSEAATISAIAARLIPTTDTPGASEAGVIHFIDRAFADGLSGDLDGARAGLAAFNLAVDTVQPGTPFSGVSPEVQDKILRDQEGSAFFEQIREMTIIGFFAMSSHGGNRDHLGWDLIGFEGHGAWTSPFGHYDGEVMKHDG
jgi:gluconate 2-dehydrogenase gamma chain